MQSDWSTELLSFEHQWIELQPFLRDNGYELRARYQPDWTPSWTQTEEPRGSSLKYEDGVPVMKPNILDATRASDGKPVMLKLIEQEDLSEQHLRYLNGEGRSADPRNHTVPLIEVLRPSLFPRLAVIITPRLVPWEIWPFHCISEIVDFISQLLEGLAFMHDLNFVHLDASVANIMMDGLHLYLEPGHPAAPRRVINDFRDARHLERHESPTAVKYYYIDFGQSVRFESLEDRRPLRRPGAQDKTVPEERSPEPFDPFALDVYCVGNIVKEHILQVYENVKFLRPLVEDMVRKKPSTRLTASEASARFSAMRMALDEPDLRKPLQSTPRSISGAFKIRKDDRPVKRADTQVRTTATRPSRRNFLDTMLLRIARLRTSHSRSAE